MRAIITACPGKYWKRYPLMSAMSRRERTDACSTRASGTVRSATARQFNWKG